MKLILLNIINNATHTCYLLTQIYKQSIWHLSLKKIYSCKHADLFSSWENWVSFSASGQCSSPGIIRMLIFKANWHLSTWRAMFSKFDPQFVLHCCGPMLNLYLADHIRTYKKVLAFVSWIIHLNSEHDPPRVPHYHGSVTKLSK